MNDILNLDRFPLHQPGHAAYRELVRRCQDDLNTEGMFNLTGFVRTAQLQKAVEELSPAMRTEAFTHRRSHNIYFKKDIPGLPAHHPALVEVQTVNHTLCADQLAGNVVLQIYEWPPLARFLADVMDKAILHTMADPLARVNVMAYRDGETLNWHFDRSEFTTTVLLQAPVQGGKFEYRTGLRSADDPNYDGVAKLLKGEDREMKSINPTPGTLNVFRGVNTPHRVTTVHGNRDRLIAVYSYYDRPDVVFTPEEQIGFYGRVA